VPFLYGVVVTEFHWLDERQFLDAVAVAMITLGRCSLSLAGPRRSRERLPAVVTQGDQHFCFRVEDGKARRTMLRIGARDAKFVEVLKKQKPGKETGWEDFTGKEEVVVTNPASLSDGQTVTAERGP
jgi:hypothetical protein